MLHELKRKAMQNPEDPEARYALAEALFGEKQYDAAIKQLEKAIELAPDHPSARVMLARAYQREGRLTLAERTLEQQVRRFPSSADARDELAGLLLKGRRVDDAIVHLEEAVRVDPDNLSRRRLVAELALQKQLFARARVHLEAASRLDPGDKDIAEQLEFVLTAVGATAAPSSPLDRGPAFLAGRTRAALAAEPLRRALAAGALKEAAALLRKSDVAGAKRALVTASREEQETSAFAFLRGEIFLLGGDRDRAEQAFLRAAEHPREPLLVAVGRLGEICAAAARHKDAARWFNAWVKVDPTNADALEGLGDALLAEGRPADAKVHFEKALETRPDEALAQKVTVVRAACQPASRSESETCARIGVLTWTPTGGGVSFIEAVAVRGKGELIYTGNVGPSWQESAKVAFSCLKARADSLGIAPALARSDLHIHRVDVDIHIDGASAGLALTLAALSALSGRALRPSLAATGAISLQGAVHRIDGLHEKVSAAYLAGIRTVILPRKNLFDLKRLPAEVVSRVEVFYVDSLTEAVAIALAPREGE
jgi:ATP-dependent Lon protease